MHGTRSEGPTPFERRRAGPPVGAAEVRAPAAARIVAAALLAVAIAACGRGGSGAGSSGGARPGAPGAPSAPGRLATGHLPADAEQLRPAPEVKVPAPAPEPRTPTDDDSALAENVVLLEPAQAPALEVTP